MKKLFIYFTSLIAIYFISMNGVASDAEIIDVKAELNAAQKFNISVTLKHDDTGWEHYANAWRIYSPDGMLIAERVLHHPHVKEQPFTRNLLAVSIPADISEIIIAAVCSNTGESEKRYTLKLR